jgi:sec-independent protein translocase protein TatA
MGRIWELVLILAIILIFFGAGKLPSVMKDVGKSIRGLKDGMKDDDKKDEKDEKDSEK